MNDLFPVSNKSSGVVKKDKDVTTVETPTDQPDE